MKHLYPLFAALLLGNVCSAQSKDMTASDLSARIVAMKNREIKPATPNPDITLDIILKGGPEDTGRFNATDYATVTGYVLGVDDEGPELSNAYSSDSNTHNIRIYIGQSLNSWKDSVFVVELTAKYKAMHPNMNTDALFGQKITVAGYMMYNFDAKKLALNANKKSRTTDRKTAWEICPVTELSVLSGVATK